MLIHPPDKLQNTLDYLNYSGVVFYRDNERYIQNEKSDTNPQSNVSVMENFQSERPKLAKICLLCANTITNDEYKILGKKNYL